ncbi:MAG: hypothetical protein AAF204_03325 [Pseudomonadota bacterium]
MLSAEDSQFRLSEDGQITYQAQASNPLAGEPIAMLAKGDEILKPKIVMLDGDILQDQDKNALREHLEGWFTRHVAAVLEPLVGLKNTNDMKAATKGIAFQVHEALGIVSREQLESLILELDADDRRDLRSLKIRLGPILVFIPALNKPAAVRLRALLWGLFNEKDLPMECPKDGIVSFEVDPKAVDQSFYQAIAYPVYGKRAIRIDMLDRVICGVYDTAERGKFKAAHTWAEWLGSSIEGLYEVLEAMGHKKVYDPADEKPEEVEGAEAVAEPEPEEEKPVDGKTEEAKPQEQVKPELATFRLKKGKAFEKSAPRKAHGKNNKPEKRKGKRNKSTNRTPKIMSAGPEKKLEDSPFAVLEQLKQSNEKS